MAMQIDMTSRFLLFVSWEISPFHGAQRTTSAFCCLIFLFPLFKFPLSVCAKRLGPLNNVVQSPRPGQYRSSTAHRYIHTETQTLMACIETRTHTHVHPGSKQTSKLWKDMALPVCAGGWGCAFMCLRTTGFLKILTWCNLELKKRGKLLRGTGWSALIVVSCMSTTCAENSLIHILKTRKSQL